MSHFLCGEILLSSKTNEELENIDWLFRLLEAGPKHQLCIQFGANISQKIVFEILGHGQNRIQRNLLPFVVLGSPISNTSDDLFYPSVSPYSTKERLDLLNRRIDEIASWVNAAFNEVQTVGMSIYLSEGYDTSYDQRNCLLNDFSATLNQILLGTDVVPSTKITIARG